MALLADEGRDCRKSLIWAERFLIPVSGATSTDIWYRDDVQSLMALIRGGQSLCDAIGGIAHIAQDIREASGTGIALPTEVLIAHSGALHTSRIALEQALAEYRRIGVL